MLDVQSADNPRIKHVRALLQDARARARASEMVLEGEHLVRAWLDHQLPLTALVVDSAQVDHAAVRRILERSGRTITQLRVPTKLMAALSSLQTPPEVMAVVGVPAPAVWHGAEDALALDGVQDPGNVGTMLRTAAAAGVRWAILGPGCASPWSPKALRAGMGAQATLHILEVSDLAAWLRGCGTQSFGTAGEAVRDLYALDLQAPMVWVMGNEGAGLSAVVRAALSDQLRIPQVPDVESLNVAGAAAVCLFEMRRQRLQR